MAVLTPEEIAALYPGTQGREGTTGTKPYVPEFPGVQPLSFGAVGNNTSASDTFYNPGQTGNMVKKADGTMVPNPFNLTPEQIYFALSGNQQAYMRLMESLGATGGQDASGKMTPANTLFHQIINYYEPGGGAYNGGGYTAEDSARAAQNYSKDASGTDAGGNKLGEAIGDKSPEALAYMVANGQAVKGSDGKYYYPADPYYTKGGAGYGGAAGAALGYGGGSSGAPGGNTGVVPPPKVGGGTIGGGNPGGTGTTPVTGGTPGGSTNLGNTGDAGDFPMASAAPASAYTAAPRPSSTTDPFDFMNDEGYKFLLNEGTKGIQNSAAARGNLQSGNTLKDLAKFQTGLASQEYGNAFNRYDTSRKFAENQYTGDRAFDFGAQTDARNYNNANRMWDTSFNNNNRIDARNFDYAAATGDRAFNWAKDVDNRNFGYQAATGDRAFNANTLQSLANMGLGASGQSGNLAATLAAILGNNTMTGAGAGANATVGTGNNTNAFISNLLNMLYGNSIVNSVGGGG